jgi:hypothetical protein
MKILTRCLLALLAVPGLALARPVFVENVSTITNPNPALWTEFPRNVAVAGDYALVGAEYWDQSNPQLPQVHQTAFLYQRNGTGWNLVRQLDETVVNGGIPRNWTNVAMDGQVAVVSTTPMTIYELGPSGWARAPSDIPIPTRDSLDLELQGGRIINGELGCASNAAIIEKSSDGVWRKSATLSGAPHDCNSDAHGGGASIFGDWAVVPQESGLGIPANEQQAWIFRYQGAQGWVRHSAAPVPHELRYLSWYAHSAISGPDVFMSAGVVNGIHVLRDVPGQGFQIADRIRPLDVAMGGGDTSQLEVSGDYLLQRTYLFDRWLPPTALNVYRRMDTGYEHAATLVHRGNAQWFAATYAHPNNSSAISGRTVLATDGYNRVVYHWELPATLATPAPRQETFNVGIATNWSTTAGSQYRVLRGDRSRVLRQSETAIDTRAIFQPADWTNQAIEVDVKPNQFADATSAISLVTRWQGAHNYYELVWSPARIEFRRMASGTLRTLFSEPWTSYGSLLPGQNRRMRLESIGTRHQVYIDGVPRFSVFTTGPTHGRVGLSTYRASVDFDNVQITPTPLYSMFRSQFYSGETVPWQASGVGQWQMDWGENSNVRLVQPSTAGEGRVTVGAPATEQRVQASARVMAFAPPDSTWRRWFGLVARYVDEDNHYILALRPSNMLVLTRRANGVDTSLGSFAVNVVPEQYYSIRLDAIGDQLRAYLDDRLLFEATDATHPSGNSGMTTFKAHVEFESFHAYQP